MTRVSHKMPHTVAVVTDRTNSHALISDTP
jgi:hypothetical protein